MNYREVLQTYKHYLMGGCIVIVVICSMIFFFFSKSNSQSVEEEELIQTSISSSVQTDTESLSKQIYVDIKGAVKKPGMYEGSADMRVWDAVMLAGGVSEEADTKQVNFSERIIDQMVIYVPKVGEEIQSTEKNNDSQGSQSKETNKINLNQANETELQALPGIGQKKAQEIIRYREENGGFKSIEDLKNISGFGEKTFEKLKDSITS
ncbi:helix-hairpin-helix domain-containing protein [Candidatus Enterococcus ikei]|uniref:Helix-hairpin-helix domain-containing protein n=1 Tax=Candidatus Enterococcus ikei TaxID=2815326 RepID=A0ABS3GXQ7_9ENTE|nr:helix-hairpin-helix domain-containing protein [Enterococcus sp. DIV0869a]MBO0439769.1 helix-hairpin-helix domain-containing protein [Enterococcus sp. DIV0869a]